MDKSDSNKPTVKQIIRNNNETSLTTYISGDEGIKGDAARLTKIISLVANSNPDVFALYEVEGKEVYYALMALMPNYQFHITEGAQAHCSPSGKTTSTPLFYFYMSKVAHPLSVLDSETTCSIGRSNLKGFWIKKLEVGTELGICS